MLVGVVVLISFGPGSSAENIRAYDAEYTTLSLYQSSAISLPSGSF